MLCKRMHRVEQAAERLTPVSASVPHLLEQFPFGPGRLTLPVPVAEHRERLVIGKSKPTNESTADSERADISVLSCDRRRDTSYEASSTIDRCEPSESRNDSRLCWCSRRARHAHGWKFRWNEHAIHPPVVNVDQ